MKSGIKTGPADRTASGRKGRRARQRAYAKASGVRLGAIGKGGALR